MVAPIKFLMLKTWLYIWLWQILKYLDRAMIIMNRILQENRKAVIIAWNRQDSRDGSVFRMSISILYGCKYPQMSKSTMARRITMAFWTVLKCLILAIVQMIRTLPTVPVIYITIDNIRHPTRVPTLYNSVVRFIVIADSEIAPQWAVMVLSNYGEKPYSWFLE